MFHLASALACVATAPPEPTATSGPEGPVTLGDAPPADTGAPTGVALLTLSPEAPITSGERVGAQLSVVPAIRRVGPGEGAPTLETRASVEVRGASSTIFPKVSYNVELQTALREDRALPLLGMPPEADWALYGPYTDKTAIRNALTYTLARRMGGWAPRVRFAELVIGRSYEGLYVALEKPELDDARVDLPEPTDADPTGAFLFKLEGGTDGGAGWQSAAGTIYELHDPGVGEITVGQFNALVAGVDRFEAGIAAGEPPATLLDVPSFVDFVIVQELARNVDAYRRSTFLQLEPASLGGRLRAGPVWDFDIAWGNADFCDGWRTEGLVWEAEEVCEDWDQIPPWWLHLLADPRFKEPLRCRWEELRAGPLAEAELDALIDALSGPIRAARARDADRWGTLGQSVWPNWYVGDTHAEEVAWLRAWIHARVQWLDTNLPGVCVPFGPGAP